MSVSALAILLARRILAQPPAVEAMAENTFAVKVDQSPSRTIAVEIGDSKQAAFYPQFKSSHFDNECNLSIRLMDDDPTGGAVVHKAESVEWSRAGRTARFYPVASDDEHGAFEFDVVLDGPPSSNRLDFTLNFKDADFYYQGELTAEEIKEGCRRPENVVGSYAVYASTAKTNYVGGKEYRTGKLGHIYRPRVRDAKGAEVWGVLAIDAAAGVLSITIPQAFLDSAVYPVTVDPTFGYTTQGGTALQNLKNTVAALGAIVSPLTASSGDTITSFSICADNQEGGGFENKASFSAYTLVAGVVTSRLAEPVDVSITSATKQWWTTPAVSQALVAGSSYCVGMSSQNNGSSDAWEDYYDAGSAPGRFNSTSTTLDASFSPTGTDSGRHYSIYATYTSGGSTQNGRFFQMF